MNSRFAFLVRISILFLSLFCLATPVQANGSSLQITPTALVSANVSFYQQQLDKLSYSVRKDGSFSTGQSESLSVLSRRSSRAQLGGDIKSDRTPGQMPTDQAEEKVGRAEDKRTVEDGDVLSEASQTPLHHIARKRSQRDKQLVQPSVETVDHARFSDQSESFRKNLGETVLLEKLFQEGPRTRSSRHNPYAIINAARETRKNMQPTNSLLSGLRNRFHAFDSVRDQQETQGTAVLRRQSKTQLYENARELKRQLERKFLLEDVGLMNMPATLLSRVRLHTDRTKAAVDERIRAKAKSLLKEIESKAGEAAESM